MGLNWSGVDPPLSSSRACLTTFIANSAPMGGGGTPTYISQNDPHDALIILNIHTWSKNLFSKIFSTHQHRGRTDKIGSWTWEPTPPPPHHPGSRVPPPSEQISGRVHNPALQRLTAEFQAKFQKVWPSSQGKGYSEGAMHSTTLSFVSYVNLHAPPLPCAEPSFLRNTRLKDLGPGKPDPGRG